MISSRPLIGPPSLPLCFVTPIRETPTFSTNADSRTDTILERLHDLKGDRGEITDRQTLRLYERIGLGADSLKKRRF